MLNVTVAVTCDGCHETDHWSATAKQARQEARRQGWVRRKDPVTGQWQDLCRR